MVNKPISGVITYNHSTVAGGADTPNFLGCRKILAENNHFLEVQGKIEILSAHNLVCQKFAAVCLLNCWNSRAAVSVAARRRWLAALRLHMRHFHEIFDQPWPLH